MPSASDTSLATAPAVHLQVLLWHSACMPLVTRNIYGRFHFDHCDGCNLCAIQKVVEVLFNHGDIQTSTVTSWKVALYYYII